MGIPAAPPVARVVLCSDRVFLWRLCASAWVLRFVIIVIFQVTGAIHRLRLSPDSERYHREALFTVQQMKFGDFNWPNWIDNGWFQFTGLVYWALWPSPFLIQLLNITVGTLTVIPLFLIMRRITPDVRAQRFYAILAAFFPSLVYWSCLMLKDPVSILALALIVYSAVELRLKFSWKPLLLTLLGLFIYLGTRIYLFVVLIMLMPAVFLLFPRKRVPLRAVVIPALIGLVPIIFGYGYFASGAFQTSMYFDLDYINHLRTAMGDHGGSAIFNADDVHIWGKDPVQDVLAAIRTAFAVFIPVNPFDIGGTRQMMALPLVFIMGYLMYLCVPGAMIMWRARKIAAPVIIFGTAVLGVYVGGTTNGGALFRWTTQIMPYILMTGVLGLYQRDRRRVARFATRLVRQFSRRSSPGLTPRPYAAPLRR